MGFYYNIIFKNKKVKESFINVLKNKYPNKEALINVFFQDKEELYYHIEDNKQMYSLFFNAVNPEMLHVASPNGYGYRTEDEDWNTRIVTNLGSFEIDSRNNVSMVGEFNKMKDNYDGDFARMRKEAKLIALEKDIFVEFEMCC